jgi:hypothetical protein
MSLIASLCARKISRERGGPAAEEQDEEEE